MSDGRTNGGRSKRYAEEVSPDSLMTDFRGSPFALIVGFTIIFHVVLIGVFSLGYLGEQLFGEDTSGLTEEQRMEVAVREATSSLREIAKRHGVRPQDLSERFASGRAKTSDDSVPASSTEEQPETPVGGEDTPEQPESAIEKELQEKKDGPELPDLPSIDDEEDLF